MKKVFLMLVAVATFALVSCGGSKDDKKAAPADGAAKSEKVSKVKEAANAEEAGMAIVTELGDAVTVLTACEDKEDVKALVEALADDMKYLGETYPDYNPDPETKKAIEDAAVAVGEAIGTVGVNLGMDASDIAELQGMLSK